MTSFCILSDESQSSPQSTWTRPQPSSCLFLMFVSESFMCFFHNAGPTPLLAGRRWNVFVDTLLCFIVYIDAHLPHFHSSEEASADTLRKRRLRTGLDEQPVKVDFCPGLQALRGLGQGTQFIFAPGPPSGLIKQ